VNEEKRQQVIALGRLGWSLRRIERDYICIATLRTRREIGISIISKVIIYAQSAGKPMRIGLILNGKIIFLC
jgi:hypothetical protein